MVFRNDKKNSFSSWIRLTTQNDSNEDGAIIVLVAITLACAIALSGVLIARVGNFVHAENLAHFNEEVLSVAEGGIDFALWKLNEDTNYVGESGIVLGDGEFDITVTDIDSSTKKVVATAYLPNKENPAVTKIIEVEVVRSNSVINFPYGMQTGELGLKVGGGSTIQGSIYSNGEVEIGSNASIGGSVWVAAASSGVGIAYETTDGDYQFGDITSRRATAQSFIPNSNMTVNAIEVLLRKTGAPSSFALFILADDLGKPGSKNTHLISQAFVHNSWVTTDLAWISASLASNPILTAGQTYWLVLNPNTNSSSYYHWASDSNNEYGDGKGMFTGSIEKAIWYDANIDFAFRIIESAGGATFTGDSGTTVGGDLHANHISTVGISGEAYYQTITNATASAYHPGSDDPATLDFPISSAQVTDWKNEAAAGTNYLNEEDYCGDTIGPAKIAGSLSLGGNCTLTLSGTVWVDGDLTLDNNNIIQLDNSFGANGGVIVVTGKVSLKNGNVLTGSGEGDSYLLLVSEFASDDIFAIDVNNNNLIHGILYAANGIISVDNTTEILEITGKGVQIGNNTSVLYESGLANATFLAGSSSSESWSVRDGSWKESTF